MNNGLTKRVLRHTVDLAAALLKIPRFALKMFRMADELSGLERKTIPTELIPLNTIQLARGLLNYAALQSLPGWVFPYWAERQLDPSDRAFIPRSHLGLSINVTGRNWTAVGSPDCPVEPVVDPHGAVMPFRNRWSLDVWVKNEAGAFFPSQLKDVHQELLGGLPIVRTRFACGDLKVEETAYVDASVFCLDVSVENFSDMPRQFRLAFAVRPFNAEGVAPVHDIEYKPDEKSFRIDTAEHVYFDREPEQVYCSNRAEGDSAAVFAEGLPHLHQCASSCEAGLANGFAAYALSLGAREKALFSVSVPLEQEDAGQTRTTANPERVSRAWTELLGHGAEILMPDERMNQFLRSSLSTLLLLTDGDDITPGPWTYHQFWFRDAAYMLRALDAYGYHQQSRMVISSFPRRQDRTGYFRSQQGEWDSNGQALWTVWHHTELTGDASLARGFFEKARKGVQWISHKRLTGPRDAARPFAGLMPAGLSAEHLGLCDYYFWDNWWSIAGLQSFARLARRLGRTREAERAETQLLDYRRSMDRAIQFIQQKKGLEEIPAGPLRGIDSGMVGSCVAWYPLQEYPPEDNSMLKTVRTLTDRFVRNGLFFQDFVHSGGNPYLSLQLAQAWLFAGRRNEFWKLFSTVLDAASPTLNFPEAIHPQTGGGAMGDGHHGWAAAEVVMAFRNAIVQENWRGGNAAPDLVLLGGIPSEWCAPGKQLVAHCLPLPGGVMSLTLATSTDGSTVEITFLEKEPCAQGEWTVKLPLKASGVTVDGASVSSCTSEEGETVVQLKGKAGKTIVVFKKQEMGDGAQHPYQTSDVIRQT